MQRLEAHQRAAIVAEARSWLGTPYHHEARVKGRDGGVDCAQLLIGVYAAVGLIPPLDIPHYPPDWHLHRDAERYLGIVLQHAREIQPAFGEGPLPGDVVVWRFGRCFSHGAIVIDWPVVIHAHLGRRCALENVEQAHWLRYVGESRTGRGRVRPMRCFSYWGAGA